MCVYLDLVILLNICVDFLLLLGTNRLSGYGSQCLRLGLSSILGGLYAGACMLPGFSFLSNVIWRLVSLAIMAVIAFGADRSALRRGTVFVFLSMALGGIATGLGKNSFSALILSAGILTGMCFIGFRGNIGLKQYAKVQIRYGGKSFDLTALRDTGNTLIDPLTGGHVLIAGPELAWDMLGITQQQLADPIGTIGQGRYPRLRLIPYRAVGQSCGMLLALSADGIMIDGRKVNPLVAFAPNGFGKEEVYQALTGGVV